MLPTFDLLDLQPTEDDLRYRFVVQPVLCTPFGFLYGGGGIAASAEAAERATGRPLQWITTQFIGSPPPNSVVDLQVTIPANGRVTTQSQVVGTVDGEPMFASLCAHTVRPSGDGARFVTMPTAPPPEECPEMSEPFALDLSGSFFDTLDRRLAIGAVGPDAIGNPQTGTIAMWCRIRDHEIGNPASQAYVADIIPLAIGAALGAIPGATSIDNTLPRGRPRADRLGAPRTHPRGLPPLDRPRLTADVEPGRPADGHRPADLHRAHQPSRPPLKPTRVDPPSIYLDHRSIYTGGVTKRLIDVDDEALDAARVRLGTSTIKDTVNEALRETARQRDTQLSSALSVLADADLDDRAAAWR